MNGIGGQLRGGKVIEKEAVSHVLVAGLTTGGGCWELGAMLAVRLQERISAKE